MSTERKLPTSNSPVAVLWTAGDTPSTDISGIRDVKRPRNCALPVASPPAVAKIRVMKGTRTTARTPTVATTATRARTDSVRSGRNNTARTIPTIAPIIPVRLKLTTVHPTINPTAIAFVRGRKVLARVNGITIATLEPSAIEWPNAPSARVMPPRSWSGPQFA